MEKKNWSSGEHFLIVSNSPISDAPSMIPKSITQDKDRGGYYLSTKKKEHAYFFQAPAGTTTAPNIRTGVHKALLYFSAFLAQDISNSYAAESNKNYNFRHEIYIPDMMKTYSAPCTDANYRKFRAELAEDIKTLGMMSYVEEGRYGVKVLPFFSLLELTKTKTAIVTFNPEFVRQLATNLKLAYLPKKVLELSGRRPSLVPIVVKLAIHNSINNNVTNETNNTIKLTNLLAAVGTIPSIEETTATNRQTKQRIFEKLDADLEALHTCGILKEFTWRRGASDNPNKKICNKKGEIIGVKLPDEEFTHIGKPETLNKLYLEGLMLTDEEFTRIGSPEMLNKLYLDFEFQDPINHELRIEEQRKEKEKRDKERREQQAKERRRKKAQKKQDRR